MPGRYASARTALHAVVTAAKCAAANRLLNALMLKYFLLSTLFATESVRI
jgi:hypothetical protein